MFTRRQGRLCLIACAAGFFLLTSTRASAQAERPAPPRALTVTVMDKKGGLVTGLARESFTVLDGGRPSEIVSFASGDSPATVGVLLDASASMSTKRLGFIRAAVTRFLKGCHPSDEFFLMAFNQRPQMIQGMTDDPGAVLAALDRYAAIQPKGFTALYDALYLALNGAAHGRHSRRAVVLLTDGQDNVSSYKFKEVRQQLMESDVIVYAVGIVDPNEDSSSLGYGGRAILEELTGLSGGRAFFPATEKELNAAFDDLARELRNQYVIGFAPAADGKQDGWHELRVKLGEVRDGSGKKVKAVARTRSGFYDVPPARRN
ncbi:MAG: VWA domain-containing protein [Pyrinomonadaceae bacterium]